MKAAINLEIARPHLSRIQPAPNRILIKAVNWLGDVVMSLPAMRAIRRAFPEAHLAALIKSDLASFFDGVDWIDEVIPYSITPYSVAKVFRGLDDRRKLIAEVRARHFDLAIVMPNSFESALWIRAAGIPMRAGFARDARGAMLTHKAAPPRDALDGHQVKYWLAMVRDTLGLEIDVEVDTHIADIMISPATPNLVRMRDWLASHRRRPHSSLIAIAPAAAYGPAKEWPAEKFALLVDQLREKIDAECVLVGAPSERAKCEAVAALSSNGAVVAAGETSVGELIALLSLSSAFIGNDSGSMHLANALEIPTVGIFGSTNPLRTGPEGKNSRVIWHRLECSPCLARTCRYGHYNCLRQIEPKEVLEALESVRPN